MKLLDCLPLEISDSLQKIRDIRELRIRDNCAVKINVAGHWYCLGKNGLLLASAKSAIVADKDCDEIVKKVCGNSIYAYEKSLANGYFTLEDGTRIGVCGHLFGKDKKVFQKYTSLCFRVPHYVNCVTDEVLNKCIHCNTLVLGVPASGKTTYLRDIAVKLGPNYNVLVVDERGELFYDENLIALSNCDVLKWSDKLYAFEAGARALSPQYIVCDELSTDDIPFVKSCIASGIRLICSAHASTEKDFDTRFGLLDLFGLVVNLNSKQIVSNMCRNECSYAKFDKM